MDTLDFWIFLSVCVICDAWLFSKGYNAFFYKHKTDEEKEIRKAIINNLKNKKGE